MENRREDIYIFFNRKVSLYIPWACIEIAELRRKSSVKCTAPKSRKLHQQSPLFGTSSQKGSGKFGSKNGHEVWIRLTELDIVQILNLLSSDYEEAGNVLPVSSVRYGLEVQWSLVRNIRTRGLRLLTRSIANS
jgi:hypothetical protein